MLEVLFTDWVFIQDEKFPHTLVCLNKSHDMDHVSVQFFFFKTPVYCCYGASLLVAKFKVV